VPRKRRKQPKKPIIPSSIRTSKIPVYLGSPYLEGRPLTWRLSSADIDGPFSCGKFTYDDFKLLWDKLRAFETMSIAQLRQAQSFHSVPTASISREAKVRLEERRLDDVDVIYGFHIMGTCRLWCMKHENILSVLWWDRNHEVYPVKKKRT